MNEYWLSYSPLIFPALMFVLFRTSRDMVNEMYNALLRIFKSEHLTIWIISLLLTPGTLLHELCHYLTAKILLLRVLSFRILPRRIDSRVQLGEVTYQKADKVRGLIVGIAPVIGGVVMLALLGYNFDRIPQTPLALTISYYLLLSITTTMYSSPEDMKGSFVALPILIFLGVMFWVYKLLHLQLIPAEISQNGYLALTDGLSTVNFMLIIAIAAHAIIILALNAVSWSLRN